MDEMLNKAYVQGEVRQGCFSERVIAEKNIEKIGIVKLFHHYCNLHLFIGKYLSFSFFTISTNNHNLKRKSHGMYEWKRTSFCILTQEAVLDRQEWLV